MPNHTPEELNACQRSYLAWAKANKRKAVARLDFRNAWLRKVGRPEHCMTLAEIRDL